MLKLAAVVLVGFAAAAQPVLLGKPVTAKLAGGEQHEYALRLRAGMFAHVVVEQQGIDVVVTAHAPDGKVIAEIDSPNGARGPEPLGFAAAATGTHRVVVRSFDAKAAAGEYTIRVDELLSPAEYRARLAEELRREAAVTKWLREQAMAFDDLAPLANTLRDARVVGLGEATHGSHEIFTVKQRLIEHLVTKLGFRMIAFEGTASGAAAINAYIQGGDDRAAMNAALDSIWITSNSEVRALVEWLRTHNASTTDRVTFVGLDPQGSASAIATLRAFPIEERVRPLLEIVRTEDEKSNRFERTNITPEQVQGLEHLIAWLVAREGELVRRTSSRDYAAALDAARLLVQFAQFNSSLPDAMTRDAAMAENFFRAMQRQPGTRAIVWAHNAHISTSDRSSYKPLGTLLRNAYGNGYYAIATSFERGAFLAQVPGSTPPDVRAFTVPAAPRGTIDAVLAAMNLPLAFVDLRKPAPPVVAEWLGQPRRMHWIGALYADTFTEAQRFQPFVVNRDFDGVAFIATTSAARAVTTPAR
ncbi:MAG TPA: erythromycin esterase family protein [Thermoanaerobaculia bacterium]|nr:erythromycin esterase family protein [Thermoanaerobaculia bacterium]